MDPKSSKGAATRMGAAVQAAAPRTPAGATVTSAAGGAMPPVTDTVAGAGGVPVVNPPVATTGAPGVAAAPEDGLASGELSAHRSETAIDAGIGAALAGRRPLPTPATEAAAAIAETAIDPRPGSGSLDENGFRTGFEGLSADEIAAVNARLALMHPGDLDLFRAELAKAPIAVGGQGSLDDRLRFPVGGALAIERPVLAAAEIVSKPARTDVSGPALRVISTREGFRRGGRAWSTSPIVVPLAELTAAQVAMIESEPLLIVERV